MTDVKRVEIVTAHLNCVAERVGHVLGGVGDGIAPTDDHSGNRKRPKNTQTHGILLQGRPPIVPQEQSMTPVQWMTRQEGGAACLVVGLGDNELHAMDGVSETLTACRQFMASRCDRTRFCGLSPFC